MLEELLEGVFSPWALLAVAAVTIPGGRKFLRSATKEVIRAGLVVGDRIKDMASEIKEETDDVVAEVRAEREEHNHSKAQSVRTKSAS